MDFKFWLLNEEENQVEGLDKVIDLIKTRHPTVADSLLEKVKQFIQLSGLKKIQIVDMTAYGAALYDKIIINNNVFSMSLELIIYTLFHETAHQYQFKKYGFTELTKFAHREMDVKQAVQFLRKTENIADNFAIRKIQQLKNSGENIDFKIRPFYKDIPDSILEGLISSIRRELEDRDETDPIAYAEAIYNITRVVERAN